MEVGEGQNTPPIEGDNSVNGQSDFRAARRALSETGSEKTTNPAQAIQEYLGSFKEQSENEQFIKRTEDLRRVIKVHQKVADGAQLDADDLKFIYQTDSKIDDFGFGEDLGITGLIKARDVDKDILVLFECEPSQIARGVEEVNEGTKVYVGPLSKDVLEALKKFNIENIFSSFPSQKVKLDDLETGGKSTNQLREEFASQNIPLSGYAGELLDKVDKVLTSPTVTEEDKDLLKNEGFSVFKDNVSLVTLTLADLGLEHDSTIDEVYEKAKSLGFGLCSADVGMYLRLKQKDQPVDDIAYVGMEPVKDDPGDPHVFSIANREGRLWLDDAWVTDTYEFDLNTKFIFSIPKQS